MTEERKLDYLVDKWSFSKCSTGAKCLRKFFLKYVVRMRETVAPWLLYGRAIHEGQEEDAYAKLRSEKLTVKQVLDCAVNALEEERKRDGIKPRECPTDPFVEEHGRQLEIFESSGERAKIVPIPGTIEAPFEIQAKVGDPEHGLEPVIIEGYTDIVSLTESGDREAIDHKSAGRPVSAKEVEDHDQLALEMTGAEARYGKIVSWVKAQKQKATTKVSEPVENTEARFKRVMRFMADTIHACRRAIKTGDFPKCDPAAFHCNKGRACEFGYLCFPEEQTDLNEFIQVEKIIPAGTLPAQEWRESGAGKRERERSAK